MYFKNYIIWNFLPIFLVNFYVLFLQCLRCINDIFLRCLSITKFFLRNSEIIFCNIFIEYTEGKIISQTLISEFGNREEK